MALSLLPTMTRKREIYIIGPSSTGKTTLCDVLAQKLGLESTAYIREVARRVMREKGYTRDTIGNLQMQIDIMDGHLQEEEKGLSSSNILLCDRSAIDPIVYAVLTAKSAEDAEERKARLVGSPAFQRALARYRDKDSIVILLAPVKSWEIDDGIRSMEDREQSMEEFETVLEDLGIAYRVVGQSAQFLYERMTIVLGMLSIM